MTYPGAMTASGIPLRRVPAWVLIVLTGLLALVAVVPVWRPWSTPEATVAAGPGRAAVQATPDALDLPADPTVLIFGDSWTYGSAASLPTLGYAYVVADIAGWTTVVDGVRGSGYLRAGIDGPAFGARIAELDPAIAPDLIIVQGSINDRLLYPAGYSDAVEAAWDALEAKYPSAQIVILGPAPHVLPVEPQTAAIDRELAGLAAARAWWYISPVRDEWITLENYAAVIDTGLGREHPSTPGHRYLAERLAAAVAAISR